MDRREVLTLIAGGGSIALSGCLESVGDGNGDGPNDELPDECPVSETLGLDWPEQLYEDIVASFIEQYEAEYLREVEIGFEPVTRYDSYGIEVDGRSITEREDGFEMRIDSGGPILTPNLDLIATVTDPPDGVEPVAIEDLENDLAKQVISDAIEEGEAANKLHHGPEVEGFLDHVDELSPDFEPPESQTEEASVYVEANDSIIELTIRPDGFHGDWWLTAWYYIDDHVLWRTTQEDEAPRDGELLECRL